MKEMVLVGHGRQVVAMPRQQWEAELSQAPEHAKTRLAFMSADHHRVRRYVVKTLPKTRAPIPPGAIAADLDLPPARVQTILDELERKLFFLVRNERGEVAWAFPVTVDVTPHRLTFSSGEQVYAA